MYDFQRLKSIPVADVLRHHGVEVRKRSDKELVCICPLPSHKSTEHKNNNPTFCISVEKNKWYCHSGTCREVGNHPRGGDVIDLVCRLDMCDVKTAAKRLSEQFGINGNTPPSKSEIQTAGVGIVPPQDVNKPSAENRNQPLAFTLKNLDPDHPFLREKGISLETAMEFGVGFHSGKGSMSNRICFPLHEDGNLIGYAGRAVNPEDEPRWKLPKGLIRSFLYGIERCDPSKPLILCESPWGVLHFHQFKHQATALVGSSLAEAQERLLVPFPIIQLAMDNDEAGRAASERIAQRLKEKHRVIKAFLKE
jgi:DNA primase